MHGASAERVWRGLLPAGVCFRVGVAPTEAVALTASERLSLGEVGSARRDEFAAGRWYAKHALAALCAGNVVELPRRPDGAPAWPAGIVGSIAHTRWDDRSFVVAAAARRSEWAGIGVDLEAPGGVEPRAWEALLTPAELARVLTLPPPGRAAAVRELWCAKEAAAKAWGGPIVLAEIEIATDASGAFVAAAPTRGPTAGACAGRVVTDAGWTCAAAMHAAP